jgi:peptidylprolyl isomerase/FKBP-type peptidyl-prolyl cis-trans isomerase FklB
MIILAICGFATSCKDNTAEELEEQELAAYKQAQWDEFEKKGEDSSYVKLTNPAGNYYVYAKKLKEGTGKKVYYNSHVSIYYVGKLTDGTVFESYVEATNTPFLCSVSSSYASTTYSSVITGWSVALQYMREGDKYEVWIPQQLAYGSKETDDIPAYSTLIFEIELVSVDVQAVAPSTSD